MSLYPYLMIFFKKLEFLLKLCYDFPLMVKEKLKEVSNKCLAHSLKKRQDQNALSLKSLSFHHQISRLHDLFESFPDTRNPSNTSKKFNDAAMGAFSLFFTQSPSFLAYQKLMRESEGKDNAQNLFGIDELLSDNHIRNLMDEVPPMAIFPFFEEIFHVLKRDNLLLSFRSYNNNFLLGLDGTQYYSSKKICCDSCCQRTHISAKSKKVRYSYHHSVLMAALVHPEKSHVISLPPEFIVPQDGNEKQDCELNASYRWLDKYAARYGSEGITILGDDLYCHHPFCERLLKLGFDFILTCKPTSHKTLYEYVEMMEDEMEILEQRRWTGRRWLVDRYRYVNGVPLRDGKDSLEVNWFELSTIVEETGEVLFHNSWTTNFDVNPKNIIQLVSDGRARWKIENENNNVLKTKGYHLEHNFGHGKKYLSQVFLTLNILAFLMHTVLEIVDAKYRRLRMAVGTRKTFFNDIKTLTKYMCFNGWNQMMIFMLKGLKLPIPDDTS